jgi:hypothetical protein
MAIECYTATKPAVPWRATGVSLGLLLGVSALAARMSFGWGERLLAERMVAPELGISFHPPRGFQPGEIGAIRGGLALPFESDKSSKARAVIVYRVVQTAKGDSLRDVCTRTIADVTPIWFRWVRRSVHLSDSRIGPLDALEAFDEQTGTFVRAACHPGGRAIVVTLNFKDGLEDAALYRAFDRSCRSITIVADSQPDRRLVRDRD